MAAAVEARTDAAGGALRPAPTDPTRAVQPMVCRRLASGLTVTTWNDGAVWIELREQRYQGARIALRYELDSAAAAELCETLTTMCGTDAGGAS